MQPLHSAPMRLAFIVSALPLMLIACGEDPPKADSTIPVIAIDEPTDGLTIESDGLVVRGTVSDPKVKGQRRSGVASVTVNGVEATLAQGDDPRAFEATLADLAPGPLLIEAVAVDGKGNLGSARVQVVIADPVLPPSDLVGIVVDPSTVLMERVGATAKPAITGYRSGDSPMDVASMAELEVEDEAVATVAADGTITAVGAGTTRLLVRLGELEASARIVVAVDSTPPGTPEIATYRPETSLRSQTWYGRIEAGATLTVTGGASTVSQTAASDGKVMLTVPLVAGKLNPIVARVTDVQGNSADFDYPIRQNDALVDPGLLKLAEGDHQRGLIDELLPQPLVVRVTDPVGAPLPNLEVDFVVIAGGGSVRSAGQLVEAAQVRIRTDAGGYARAEWRLGDTVGEKHELHATLVGDSKLPAVFSARGFAPGGGATTIVGRVFDVDRNPVEGLDVTLLEEGAEFSIDATGKTVQTDGLGRFEIGYAPEMVEPESVRLAHLRFDGTRRAAGDKYVRIDFVVPVLPSLENNGGAFYVPALPEGVALDLDASGVVQTAVTLERAMRPGESPTRVHVPVGTKVTWPANVPSDARKLALLAIPVSSTPMPLPDGLFSRQVLALQPGGTRFDPPLPLELPNLDRLAPGSGVPLMSYDHLQTRFVKTGSATVGADGTYLVSDPGSGIRVGAWHAGPPPIPPPPCPSEATVELADTPPEGPKPEQKECICEECGVRWTCLIPEIPEEPEKPMTSPNPPCSSPMGPPDPEEPPEPEPECKRRVICEEEGKVIITSPVGKKKTVKTNDKVSLRARCPDAKNDGTITWKASGGSFQGGTSGPTATISFPEEGKFTVTAKGGKDKECEGTDDAVIEVRNCIDVGVVRVCGETLEEKDIETVVSGQVTLGLVGSDEGQFMRIDKPVTCAYDTFTSKFTSAKGDATWRMDTKLVFFQLKDLTIWRGPFEIDPTGKATFEVNQSSTDDPSKYPFRLFGFPVLVRGAQILPSGVGFDTPDFKLFGGSPFASTQVWTCNKPQPVGEAAQAGDSLREPACKEESDYDMSQEEDPKKVSFEIAGLEVRTGGVVPQGKFVLENEAEFGMFKIAKLEIGYANEEFSGMVGVLFGLKRYQIGIDMAGVYGSSTDKPNTWRWKKLGLTANFARKMVSAEGVGLVVPGIPIAPVMPIVPLYFTSIGVTAEEPGVLLGLDSGTPKLSITGGFALGPGVEINDETYALATGSITGSWSPNEVSFTSSVGVLAILQTTVAGFDVEQATPDFIKGTAGITVGYGADGPSVKAAIGLEAREPFTGGLVLKGDIEGSVKTLSNPKGVLAMIKGSVDFTIPDNPIIGAQSLAKAEGVMRLRTYSNGQLPGFEVTASVRQLCLPPIIPGATRWSGTCGYHFDNDVPNGLRIYFRTADIAVPLFGKHPDKLAKPKVPSAPGLGVSRGVGATQDYAGLPPVFDVIDDGGDLNVVLEHDGAVDADLELPDGTVYTRADSPIIDPAGTLVALFHELPGVGQSYWLVADAMPGTYRLVDIRGEGQLRSVSASLAAEAPTFVFEGHDQEDDVVTIAWSGEADEALEVMFSALPVDGGDRITVGSASITAGELTWDLAGVAPGAYRLEADINDGVTGAQTIASPELVHVGGDVDAGPALVRAVDTSEGIAVSWLPSIDAEHYLVELERGGAVVAETTVAGLSTRTVIDASLGSLAGGDAVVVRSVGADDTVSHPSRVASLRAPIVTRPPGAVVVGETWTWTPERADGSRAEVVLLAGPGALTLVDGTLSFPTTVDELGRHELSVRVDGSTSALGIVVLAEAGALPEILRRAPRDGVVGEPWSWDLGFDPADYDIVTVAGPTVVIADGVATWTPTTADTIAAQGMVSLTLAVTERATGLTTSTTAVVHFADRDDDGLDDAWEVLSGLDPETADDPTNDPDDDGLDHTAEEAAGTLGNTADSDKDGLDDGDEVATSPRDGDSDGDGLLDGAEAAFGADPMLADSDGDGVDDAAEVAAGTEPGVASADADGDGLSDERELALGSDPNLADSDGDGLVDGDEVERETRLIGVDSDGDGASDGDEVAAGTDPLSRGGDRDGDGLFDDLERVLGTHVSLGDTDGDGFLDGVEVDAETDPLVATSRPVDEPRPAANPMLLFGESETIAREPWVVSDLGVIRLYPDADRDRVPDDFELRYDYDPTDPADGASDADADNIALWREHRLGTDPTKADTDGDGASDGQELADGTDPLDAASFVAGGPITVLRFSPPRAALFTNTITGPATMQLQVLGDRASGVATDVTASSRGTTYVVAPPNAGAVSGDGYFVAAVAFAGEATVTATNNGLEAVMTLLVERFTPAKVGEVMLPGTPGRLAVSGERVVVVAGKSLCTVDVSVRETPVLGGCLALAVPINDVAMRGTLVFAALASPARLVELDVSDLELGPRLQSSIELAATPMSLALGDERIYVATTAGLLTVDPNRLPSADALDPRVVETQLANLSFSFVRRDLDRVVALDTAGTLRSYRIVGGGLVFESSAVTEDIDWDLAFRGNEVWAADLNKGIRRTTLARANGFEASLTGIFATRVVPVDDYLLVGIRGNQSLLFVSNRVVGQLPALGTIDYVLTDPTGLAADDEYHYMAGFGGGNRLEVGRHAAFQDLLGVPPIVMPLTPEPGVVIDEGPSLDVAVSARDDVRVREVRIYIDGVLQATKTAPPYAVTLQTPGVTTERTIEIHAEAEDIGANVGSFEPYTVTVRPVVDTTPPTLAFVEPFDGEYIGAGPLRVVLNPVDEYGIDRIELRRDGVLVETLEQAPWTTVLDLADEDGTSTLTAIAIDFGENTASATATVEVIENDLVKLGVTRLAPDDQTYDGQRVLVRQGTVIIDGPHDFAGLYVGRGGVVTHTAAAGTALDVGIDIVADFIGVMPTGVIDATGRGHRGQCVESCAAPNASTNQLGGSHGGVGGNGVAPAPYGDLMAPTNLGMGGGYGNSTNWPGGNGGGRIRLIADEMELFGSLRADGTTGAIHPSGGAGGAGGSIYLDVGSLTGTGLITADGGAAIGRGAGGGGRIAIQYGDTELDLDRVRARPGTAAAGREAGPGTIALRPDAERATIVIDDGNRSAFRDNTPLGATPSATPWVADLDLVIRGRSRVVAAQPFSLNTITLEGEARLSSLESAALDERGLDLDVATLVVGPQAALDVNGRGHLGACVAGCSGTTFSVQHRGGSHGGVGGGSNAASPTYGDIFAPATVGMGGGYGNSTNWDGGDGGGRIRVVTDVLTLNGAIRADGLSVNAPGATGSGGGGAGGSIHVTVGALSGGGVMSADGGGYGEMGGAGGGGRVAVTVLQPTTYDFEKATARPGMAPAATHSSGAGTVVVTRPGEKVRIVVDDDGRSLGVENPTLGWDPTDVAFDHDLDLVVRGQTQLVAVAPWRLARLDVLEQAHINHADTTATYEGGFDLEVQTLTIAANARLDVSGRGYRGACVDSCGGTTFGEPRQGGSHGGAGGGSGSVSPTYGNIFAPLSLGMGGGYGNSTNWDGGDGGGRIRIVAATLNLDGVIRADGFDAGEGTGNGGGGAGGSIYLTLGTFAGAGVVSADGAKAGSMGGAGGGGRIAVTVAEPTSFDFERFTARPGAGPDATKTGGAGTILVTRPGARSRLVVDDDDRSLGVENRALGWDPTMVPFDHDLDVVIRGMTQLVAVAPLKVARLDLLENTHLNHVDSSATYEGGLDLEVDVLTVGVDARIDVTARGYEGACRNATPCSSATAGTQSQGGSHGGIGGGGAGAPTYGDPKRPTTLGMGGGFGNSTSWHGGDGGGRVRIVATSVTLDGRLAADGLENPFNAGVSGQAGGGAGGSIWVTADTIAGSGTITADGGVSFARGSGGGGRVALEFGTLSAALRANTFARPGATSDIGGPGTVYFADDSGAATFVIDDGGRAASDSRPFGFATANDPVVLDADVVVRGSTRLVASSPLTVRALTLEGTSVLTHVPTQAGYEGGLTVVADTIEVGPTASIDVSGRGYPGQCTARAGACGAGGGTIGNVLAGARPESGGSHGGVGGGIASRTFGTPFFATTLGGGGGYGNSTNWPAGHGGGRIHLVADRIVIDGVLRADGEPPLQAGTFAGGGAGGSILVVADVLAGDGLVSAIGASIATGSGGGGGRIALRYGVLDAVRPFDLEAGDTRGGSGVDAARSGGPGSFWVVADGQRGVMRVDNGGLAHINETAPWAEVGRVRVVAVDGDEVTTDAAWLVDDLVGLTLVRALDRSTAIITANDPTILILAAPSSAVVGNAVHGRRVLPGALILGGAARVALHDEVVVDALTLTDGAVLTHPVTPGAVAERGLWVEVVGAASIDATSAIDVRERGYAGQCTTLAGGCGGGAYTFGNTSTGSGQAEGGSYGGLGAGGSPNPVYGDANAPFELGSGGGRGTSTNWYGGHGGGRIHLAAQTLALAGAVIADGGPGEDANTGAGSGGAVRIVVGTLSGAGVIHARGNTFGFFGGGGRVRVDTGTDTFTGVVDAAAGGAGAGVGTVVRD